jgi:MFS family permease
MTAVDTSGVGFRSQRGPVLIALMVTTGLVAIDATILATAVPSIVDDLGGFAQFPWLFSIYLLAQAVSVPLYAKLSDTVGRKPIILIGVGLFLIGSILCGFAWSLPALIAFRAVQGLGAGAVQPMAITIAGDIYTVAERAKVQGYLASVWAISSVAGPTLGVPVQVGAAQPDRRDGDGGPARRGRGRAVGLLDPEVAHGVEPHDALHGHSLLPGAEP